MFPIYLLAKVDKKTSSTALGYVMETMLQHEILPNIDIILRDESKFRLHSAVLLTTYTIVLDLISISCPQLLDMIRSTQITEIMETTNGQIFNLLITFIYTGECLLSSISYTEVSQLLIVIDISDIPSYFSLEATLPSTTSEPL